MADTIGNAPFVELRFDKAGTVEQGSPAALEAALATSGGTDLVVLSHGWTFEGEEPRQLYERMWPGIAASLDDRKVAVAGVVWPSKRYTTPVDDAVLAAAAGGGVLAAGEGPVATDVDDAALAEAVQAAAGLFPSPAVDAAR